MSLLPPISWTPETEVCLFYAMRGQKPVGINKHFHMLCIHKKFCQSIGQSVSSEQIWDHLSSMYNLKALDESEINPFKNSKQDFKLPSEILKVKKDQTKTSSEDSILDDDSSLKSKSNRKRTRTTAPPADSPNPATPTVKRRRQ